MSQPRYPSLYQVNTRVWLTDLSRGIGKPATLDDVSDAEIARIAEMGFDWVWLLSVWQTGSAAQQISRSKPEWLREFRETLPDLRDADIPGSGFAITDYTVHANLGGDVALARLRKRLAACGLKLMLDFVPNHMGLGHPWAKSTRSTSSPAARWTWPAPTELHDGGRPHPCLRPRPVLRRLAGHASAQLQQPGHAGGDDRSPDQNCRPVRRRALRHGHARPA